ncbi:MAG: hypothetical protein JRD68_09130 [Deltaproteobacteria bacterium]|nr:hypothetical protein [Deltaproteobacteria bacterium]
MVSSIFQEPEQDKNSGPAGPALSLQTAIRNESGKGAWLAATLFPYPNMAFGECLYYGRKRLDNLY